MNNLHLITVDTPKSPVSESYRTLRTNIMFSSPDKKIQTIMVTSSAPAEGKSTVSSNLAVIMAQSGKKTIIIDCDLRKPILHKIFQVSNLQGLSNYLIGEVEIEDVVNQTSIENLEILSSGVKPPNPAELLGSEKMGEFIKSLKKTYDYIILDTPPVVIVTDAQLVSRYADGCLLVVGAGEVDRDNPIKAKKLLTKVNAKILGVVLNKVEETGKGQYKYYDDQEDEYKKTEKKKEKKIEIPSATTTLNPSVGIINDRILIVKQLYEFMEQNQELNNEKFFEDTIKDLLNTNFSDAIDILHYYLLTKKDKTYSIFDINSIKENIGKAIKANSVEIVINGHLKNQIMEIEKYLGISF